MSYFSNLLLVFGFGFGTLIALLQLHYPLTSLQSAPSAYVRIFSYDPLIIYIENFISKQERDHLLRLGEPLYNRSTVVYENGTSFVSESRTSSTALLPDGDPIVERIVDRASEFQGFTSRSNHQALQLTRYHQGQEYRPHWDHKQGSTQSNKSEERMTTIFAILEATCEECGTRFPRLSVKWSEEDRRWCNFVDCNDEEGVTIKAIPGNALFWKNLHSTKDGDVRTLHAGLPPESGVKTGLNIWTMAG